MVCRSSGAASSPNLNLTHSPRPTAQGGASRPPAAPALATAGPASSHRLYKGHTPPTTAGGGGLFPTSVHPQESPSHNQEVENEGFDHDRPPPEWEGQTISLSEARWRHSGWTPTRRLIFASLKRIPLRSFALSRFANCGANAVVEYSPSTKRYRVRGSHCHHRMCLPCGQARANTIAINVAAACRGKQVRFIGLTLKHSQSPLRAQIARLYHSYGLLRRSRLWKDKVHGAIALLEIKRSKDGRSWHPHLHVLATTPWMPQKDLANQWYEITGDSYIVDVRPIDGPDEVTRYVCKYATKPFDPATVHNPDHLDELISSIKGRRLYIASGDWHKVKLQAKPADPGDWQILGSLDDFLADVKKDVPTATALMDILRPQQDDDTPRYPGPSPPTRFAADMPNLWPGSTTPQPGR